MEPANVKARSEGRCLDRSDRRFQSNVLPRHAHEVVKDLPLAANDLPSRGEWVGRKVKGVEMDRDEIPNVPAVGVW